MQTARKAAYDKEWRRTHAEHIKNYQKQYFARRYRTDPEFHETRINRQKQRYLSDPDKFKERSRNHYRKLSKEQKKENHIRAAQKRVRKTGRPYRPRKTPQEQQEFRKLYFLFRKELGLADRSSIKQELKRQLGGIDPSTELLDAKVAYLQAKRLLKS